MTHYIKNIQDTIRGLIEGIFRFPTASDKNLATRPVRRNQGQRMPRRGGHLNG